MKIPVQGDIADKMRACVMNYLSQNKFVHMYVVIT